jgi:hypothetical protein
MPRAERVKGSFRSKTFNPMELDVDILKALPEEGARKGKYLWDAKKSAEIAKELGPGLSGYTIMGRLILMRAHDLVTMVPVLGSSHKGTGNGWQRTEKGKEMARRTGGSRTS